jgi:outer membrane protein assembly factor BamB
VVRACAGRGSLAICLVALVIAAWAAPVGASVGADWPQLGRGSGHAGYQRVEGAIDAGTAGDLEVRWRRDLTPGGGFRPEVYAAPVVADGLVFAAPMRATMAHGALWALDAQTGDRRWKTSDLGTLVAPPAVSDGIVVVNASYPFEAIAFDAATGDTLWRQQTIFGAAEGENFQGTAPVLADGVALVASAGDNLEGDRLGKLWAFDLATGDVLWTRQQTWSRPAVAQGTVFVGNQHWDPAEGSRGNRLLAIDMLDGTLLWRVPLGGRRATVGAPSISNGSVYVTVQRPGADRLVVVAASDGTVLGTAGMHGRPNILSPPMIAPDRVVVETFGGSLESFTRGTDNLALLWGARIAQRNPDTWTCVEGACASPGGVRGVVLAVAGARARAFRLADGALLWSRRMGSGVTRLGNVSSPAISKGVVYTGSARGFLYAFG